MKVLGWTLMWMLDISLYDWGQFIRLVVILI